MRMFSAITGSRKVAPWFTTSSATRPAPSPGHPSQGRGHHRHQVVSPAVAGVGCLTRRVGSPWVPPSTRPGHSPQSVPSRLIWRGLAHEVFLVPSDQNGKPWQDSFNVIGRNVRREVPPQKKGGTLPSPRWPSCTVLRGRGASWKESGAVVIMNDEDLNDGQHGQVGARDVAEGARGGARGGPRGPRPRSAPPRTTTEYNNY